MIKKYWGIALLIAICLFLALGPQIHPIQWIVSFVALAWALGIHRNINLKNKTDEETK